MKIKTQIKSIKLNSNTIELWNVLKTYNIKSATIFKMAGEKALYNKLIELKIESKKEYLPF